MPAVVEVVGGRRRPAIVPAVVVEEEESEPTEETLEPAIVPGTPPLLVRPSPR